jgi:hypothetical protein
MMLRLQRSQVQKNLDRRIDESHQADQDDKVRPEKGHNEFKRVLHAIGREKKIDAECEKQEGTKGDGDLFYPEDVRHKKKRPMPDEEYNGFS